MPAFLNQQLSSTFNNEVCLHRLVVMYWYACQGFVRQTGKWRNWRYQPQSERVVFFQVGGAAEKWDVSDVALLRLWERMSPETEHVLLRGSQPNSSLNVFSLPLDHFSDIISNLEPDTALQQHCPSWWQRGDCPVPTRDCHRAVRWWHSGKLKILLTKKPGLVHPTASTEAKLNHWIGFRRITLLNRAQCYCGLQFNIWEQPWDSLHVLAKMWPCIFPKWILLPKTSLQKSVKHLAPRSLEHNCKYCI